MAEEEETTEAKQLIVVPNGVILWHLKLGPVAAMTAAPFKQNRADVFMFLGLGDLLPQPLLNLRRRRRQARSV